jgi:hypothetical protein
LAWRLFLGRLGRGRLLLGWLRLIHAEQALPKAGLLIGHSVTTAMSAALSLNYRLNKRASAFVRLGRGPGVTSIRSAGND